MLAQGDAYGTSTAGGGKPVVVEFVSANPTGPLHVGHGRQAALAVGITIPLMIVGLAIRKHLARGFSFGMVRR